MAVEEEADAFLAWAQTVLSDSDCKSVQDLCDGAALFAILGAIDADLFRNPYTGDTKDNWVLTIGTLKRLYKLILQYYDETLECATTHLPVPDLDAIARSSNKQHLCNLCLLVIGIAVQSDQNDVHISAIQTLDQQHQHQLMISIERVITLIKQGQEDHLRQLGESKTATDVSHADIAELQSEKDTLHQLYLEAIEQQRRLQAELDQAMTESKALAEQHALYKKQVEEERNEQADVILRQENEKLRSDLRRTEDIVAELESENERHTSQNAELHRKLDDLLSQTQDAAKLKDQMDEYRHAADKLQKAENVIEKHKKKLEEAADVRRQLKLIEEQNSDLVNRNASLEDDYKRVSAFKPLMDSYKTQMADLEARVASLQKELTISTYQQEQLSTRLKQSEDQRARDKEEAELYLDRIKELELHSDRAVSAEDEFDTSAELEEALSGTTMTDLKIQVRKLTRDLEQAGQSQSETSRVLVLENLLQDAQRTKARYEADYLEQHKQTLTLQHRLDTIQSGKSDLGDGKEAAYALRLRLNEVEQELDVCKHDNVKLEVQIEQLAKQLTTAKADLTLVSQDQVDILHSLRASLDGETDELQTALVKVRAELHSALDQNKLYMAQVNTLLMDKVDLQADNIGQREEALQRERALGDLNAKLKGKSLPQEVQDLVSALQSEAMAATQDLSSLQDKLAKAKTFIKQQDKMLKDKERIAQTPATTSDDAQQELRLAREQVRNLQREQRLMMSAFQDLGRRYMIELESGRNTSGNASNGAGSSWLSHQRRIVNPTLQLARRR